MELGGLRLINSYLSNRQQVVICNGVLSDFQGVGQAIPQGSVLRPLLFVVYVNDLSRFVLPNNSNLFSYDPTFILSFFLIDYKARCLVLYFFSVLFMELKSLFQLNC